MKVYFSATCPYCGHTSNFYTVVENQGKDRLKVFTCDSEEGGCDLPYVVSLELKPVVTTLEIGGMMDEFNDKSLSMAGPLPGE